MSERTRRDTGTLRRLVFGCLIGLIVLEGGLRVIMGNFGQSLVMRRSADPDICLELVPGLELDYTGWLWRVAPSHIAINDQGIRGPSFEQAKVPGTLRIAALGDSFTFGQGVEHEQSFPSVLGRELQAQGVPTEILNFGVPGHGTPQELAMAKARVAPLKPDLVLINVFVNDMTVEESFCAYGKGGNRFTAFLLRDVYSARLLFMLSGPLRAKWAKPPAAQSETPGQRFVDSLKQLKALGEKEGFLVAAVLLTDRDMYLDSHLCRNCEIPHDLVGQAGVHVLDMSPVWLQLQRDIAGNFIPGEDHLSVAGNELMGKALAGALASWPELRTRGL